MNAREFLKQKGVLNYDEFIAYQKADSEDHIPIEELMEEFAEMKMKNCNISDVSKSVSLEGRELLIDFAQFIENKYWDNEGIEDAVDTFIRTKGN